MSTRALSADVARKTALDDCENKIHSAFRRGLEATCVIARELGKILKDELYLLKAENFNDYVTKELRIDLRSYRRIIAVSQTIAQLQESGLELPANESQAAELARLDAHLRPKLWSDLLIRAERQDRPLTVDDVRRAIETLEEQQPEAPRSAGGTLEVEMPESGNGDAAPVPKPKPSVPQVQEAELILTEKGEAALARIRRVCGDEIADAIEEGIKPMTEREIRNWAEYDDEMMRSLVYYIMDRNWPLSKAVNFATKDIQDSTEVRELLLVARARGGIAKINLDTRARITVELTL